MKIRLRNKTSVLKHGQLPENYIDDAEVLNAFDDFFQKPFYFIELLITKTYRIKISKMFYIELSINAIEYHYGKYIEEFFKSHHYKLPWLNPFKETLQDINLDKRTFKYYQRRYFLEQIKTVRIQRLIILNFLTWIFKNKFVILHRNNKK